MRKIRLHKTAHDRLAARFASDLNESQHEAAIAPDGFNLILAGPGSGKTRVITYRVAYLVAQVVRPAAVGVEIVEMLVQPLRKQPRDHVEILVVMRRQPARVALGFFDAASSRREMARDF